MSSSCARVSRREKSAELKQAKHELLRVVDGNVDFASRRCEIRNENARVALKWFTAKPLPLQFPRQIAEQIS